MEEGKRRESWLGLSGDLYIERLSYGFRELTFFVCFSCLQLLSPSSRKKILNGKTQIRVITDLQPFHTASKKLHFGASSWKHYSVLYVVLPQIHCFLFCFFLSVGLFFFLNTITETLYIT